MIDLINKEVEMVRESTVAPLLIALMASLLVGCGQKKEGVVKELPRQEISQFTLDFVNSVNAPVMETETGKTDFRCWAANSNATAETLNVVLTDTKGISYVFSGTKRVERSEVG